MAVEAATGATPEWFCEWDDAPSKILAHHWPDIPNHRDVTKIDWSTIEPVDIITGGYPCQPFSNAGHRKGTTDDRHLWPHVLNAIRAIRPQYALLENVPGHRSMGFDQVLTDLASIGFDAKWTTLRASDIGAPHQRERLFILTYPSGIGLEAQRSSIRPAPKVAGDNDSNFALAWIGEATDIEHEIQLRWGDSAGNVMRWARMHGYPPPIITDQVSGYVDREVFGTRFPEIKPSFNPAFAEWMMGLPEGHVTEVPGLSRADQLKVIGNGVVPQQAEAALRELLDQ